MSAAEMGRPCNGTQEVWMTLRLPRRFNRMAGVLDLAHVEAHGSPSSQGDEGFDVPLFGPKPCFGGPEKTSDRT
jgi:hypothetical protein